MKNNKKKKEFLKKQSFINKYSEKKIPKKVNFKLKKKQQINVKLNSFII